MTAVDITVPKGYDRFPVPPSSRRLATADELENVLGLLYPSEAAVCRPLDLAVFDVLRRQAGAGNVVDPFYCTEFGRQAHEIGLVRGSVSGRWTLSHSLDRLKLGRLVLKYEPAGGVRPGRLQLWSPRDEEMPPDGDARAARDAGSGPEWSHARAGQRARSAEATNARAARRADSDLDGGQARAPRRARGESNADGPHEPAGQPIRALTGARDPAPIEHGFDLDIEKPWASTSAREITLAEIEDKLLRSDAVKRKWAATAEDRGLKWLVGQVNELASLPGWSPDAALSWMATVSIPEWHAKPPAFAGKAIKEALSQAKSGQLKPPASPAPAGARSVSRLQFFEPPAPVEPNFELAAREARSAREQLAQSLRPPAPPVDDDDGRQGELTGAVGL